MSCASINDFLKPCPHCGGEAKVRAYSLPLRAGVNWVVSCSDCGCMTWPYGEDAESAVKNWNRRVKDE